MHPVSPVIAIVARALLLRRQEPGLSALEVLDQALQGHHGRFIDFGDIARPPAPFGLLMAEAFDRGMLPCDWVGLLASQSHPKLETVLHQIWADEVWPQFLVRYSLYRS